MSGMMLFLASFVVLMLAVGLMAIGVLARRPAITGSCGGLGGVPGVSPDCGGACGRTCLRQRDEPSIPQHGPASRRRTGGEPMPVPAAVKDYMSRPVVTVNPDMDILEAMKVLLERRISGAPVVDRLGNLVGMLSEKDCMRVALDAGYHGQWGGRVAEYMHPEVETVDADASIFDLASRFLRREYRRYPVIKDNRLVGQISRRDVLQALTALSEERT